MQQKTLADFLAIPHYKLHNLQKRPLIEVANAVKVYRMTCSKEHPDREAVEFYLANHMAAKVKSMFTLHEPLPEWAKEVMQTYTAVLVNQGERMFNYMLLIITRESRHWHKPSVESAMWEKVKQHGTQRIVPFLKELGKCGSDSAVQKFLDFAPDITLGQYTSTIEFVFRNGHFSGGYGGLPWANIAATLDSFVQGKISLEIMVDTAYTLAHNNGPMFNKGMMYLSYSNQFKEILDVQRSGQMPEYVLHTPYIITPSVSDAFAFMRQELSDWVIPDVDWQKVMSLGALGNYSHKVPKIPPKPLIPIKISGVEAVPVGVFTVDHTTYLTILSRNAA